VKKHKETPIITAVEDHPVTIVTTLVVSVMLTLLTQYYWEDPILNVMAALAPVLALVAIVAMRVREDDDGEEETLEAEQDVRYAFVVMLSGYLSAFLARAMPQQYVWIAFMMFMTAVSYVFFRLADRHGQKKAATYERNLIDEPFPLDEKATDEFVEAGARESFYASLIESQANRW